MSFMDNLSRDPSGTGIYGQPSQANQQDPMKLVNQLKDREMKDFKDKTAFMDDRDAVRQGRLRSLYDPTGVANSQIEQQNKQGMNTAIGHDPNEMTGYEKGELGVRQAGVGLEQQRIAQTGKLGEERIGIQTAQEKLNQQKSDQINATKQADLQRKTEEANQKLELAQQRLQQSGDNQEAQLQAHKDLAAAVEERHKLELAQKDHQFSIASDQHNQQIKNMEDRLKQSGRSKTTTELNADGTKKTVTTEKGSSADTVQVKGKDGQTYEIPADKEDEWNSNHAPDESQ